MTRPYAPALAALLSLGACSSGERSATESCITTVAAGLGAPIALAADENALYVTDAERQAILAVPRNGHAGKVIAQGVQPGPLAVDDDRVYFIDSGSHIGDAALMSVRKDGGDPIALAFGASDFVALAVHGGSVYVASLLDGTVSSIPAKGGAPTTLSSGNQVIGAIAVDDSGVYFTDFGNGRVVKIPSAEEDAVVLADGQPGPTAIAVDGKTVYFANPKEGTVKAVPETGGSVRTLASGLVGPQALAVDASHVYVLENAGASEGSVTAIAKTGGARRTIARKQVDPTAIVVQGDHLYWVKRTEEALTGTTGAALEVAVGAPSAFPASECVLAPKTPTPRFADDATPSCAPTCAGDCVSGRCIESIASAPADAPNIYTLATDANALYWGSVGTTRTDMIATVPLSGGATTVLASGVSADAIVPAQGSVYWLNRTDQTLMQVPSVGGTPRVIAKRDVLPDGLIGDGTNLYWFENGKATSTVMKASVAGGEPTALVVGTMKLIGLAVDAARVYFVDTLAGDIGSVPIDGGDVKQVVSAQHLASRLVSDGTYLYFTTSPTTIDPDVTTYDGTIQRVAVEGGSPSVLVSAIFAGSLLVDGGNLVVEVGWVGRMPAAGGPVTPYGNPIYGAAAVAGGALYVANSEGTIVRVTPE